MKEFQSFYKTTKNRKFNTWCKYTTRLDTYGCGCQHDCNYCYAKAILNFRGLWSNTNPSVANIDKIKSKIKTLERGSIVKLGGMTDCFMPLEKTQKITYETIKLLNDKQIHYLIVTKSDLVADDKYIEIYDKNLAHFQITITFTNDEECFIYEKATPPSKRILAIEKLQQKGFDVSVRLSPFILEFVDIKKINSIKCDKILIEFLKVNHWIKKWFDIDYSNYSLKYGNYNHLELKTKIEMVEKIKNFKEISVGEYVKEHHEYFSQKFNFNKNDCCNLKC
jgi:DNA repair photolyase